jgi:hypothetical protein
MSRRKLKVPNTVAYWVVARDERTKEIVGSPRSFADIRDARLDKVRVEDMADPPGLVTEVSVETVLVGEFPTGWPQRPNS